MGPTLSDRLKSREFWTKVGYAVTAAWMVFVLFASNGDPKHPLFDFIFIVPLAAWTVGLLIGWLIARRGRQD